MILWRWFCDSFFLEWTAVIIFNFHTHFYEPKIYYSLYLKQKGGNNKKSVWLAKFWSLSPSTIPFLLKQLHCPSVERVCSTFFIFTKHKTHFIERALDWKFKLTPRRIIFLDNGRSHKRHSMMKWYIAAFSKSSNKTKQKPLTNHYNLMETEWVRTTVWRFHLAHGVNYSVLIKLPVCTFFGLFLMQLIKIGLCFDCDVWKCGSVCCCVRGTREKRGFH